MSNFKGNSGKWKVMEVNPVTNGWVSIESEIDNEMSRLNCTIYGSNCGNLGEISLKTKPTPSLSRKHLRC